jgi:hypothetical protein
MDQNIIKRYDQIKPALLERFKAKHPDSYSDIVKALVGLLSDDDRDGLFMDPDRITVIDYGDYQGSQLFIIAAKGYQPSNYWATECDYGSCSGCDTLQAISHYSSEPPTEDQANDYLTLALHLAQKMQRLF